MLYGSFASDKFTKPKLLQQKVVHFIPYLILFLYRLPNCKGLQRTDQRQSCRTHLIKWCPLGQLSGVWHFTVGFLLYRNVEDVNEVTSLLSVNVEWTILMEKIATFFKKYVFKSSLLNYKTPPQTNYTTFQSNSKYLLSPSDFLRNRCNNLDFTSVFGVAL